MVKAKDMYELRFRGETQKQPCFMTLEEGSTQTNSPEDVHVPATETTMVEYKGEVREEPNLSKWGERMKEKASEEEEHLPGCNVKKCETTAEMQLAKDGRKEPDAMRFRKAEPISRQERIADKMSMILRHTARDFGLNMNKEGFVDVEELISHPTMRNLTREDIEIVVNQDSSLCVNDEDGVRARLRSRVLFTRFWDRRLQHDVIPPPSR